MWRHLELFAYPNILSSVREYILAIKEIKWFKYIRLIDNFSITDSKIKMVVTRKWLVLSLSVCVYFLLLVNWASFGRAWTQFDLFYMTMKIDLSMIFVMRRFTFGFMIIWSSLVILWLLLCIVITFNFLLVNFHSNDDLSKRSVISHDYKTMHFYFSMLLSNFLLKLGCCAPEKSSWK